MTLIRCACGSTYDDIGEHWRKWWSGSMAFRYNFEVRSISVVFQQWLWIIDSLWTRIILMFVGKVFLAKQVLSLSTFVLVVVIFVNRCAWICQHGFGAGLFIWATSCYGCMVLPFMEFGRDDLWWTLPLERRSFLFDGGRSSSSSLMSMVWFWYHCTLHQYLFACVKDGLLSEFSGQLGCKFVREFFATFAGSRIASRPCQVDL